MDRIPIVYILASGRNGTLYTGVTSDLLGRIHQHRTKATGGFTAEYDVVHLVWFEVHETMESAIVREKRIKKWNRSWKLELIERRTRGGAIWRRISGFLRSNNPLRQRTTATSPWRARIEDAEFEQS